MKKHHKSQLNNQLINWKYEWKEWFAHKYDIATFLKTEFLDFRFSLNKDLNFSLFFTQLVVQTLAISYFYGDFFWGEFDSLCPCLIHFHYNKKSGHDIKKVCSIAAVGNLMVRGRAVCRICVLTKVKIEFIVPNLIKQIEWLWGMTTSKCMSICKFKGLYLNEINKPL